jgi:hypothetical protein
MSTSSRFAPIYGSSIIMVLLLSLYISQSIYPPHLPNLLWVEYHSYNVDLFFLTILLRLVAIAYVKRRKRVRLIVCLSLCMLSFLCWFSIGTWSEYNIGSYEEIHRCNSFWPFDLDIVSKSSKEKRRHFSGIARREVIEKQKGKCASCKQKLLLLEWIWITKTVTVLTTSLPTFRYCALHAIGENIYKLNHSQGVATFQSSI